jgi:methyltransferase (TIGR00027 family)
MHQTRPSQTALRVAQRRAAHQLLDAPLILDDPLALTILGSEAAAKLRAELGGARENRVAVAMRAWMAVRSRFAEDQLAAAVAAGTRQYVVLGAGLDTFAYRNPWQDMEAGGLHVFEVDFPATQAWKREMLASGGICVPESVTFAPVDFERESLADGLARAGFVSGQPAFFSWLGVTMYLAPATTLATLRWVHEKCSGNGIAFDYSVPRESLSLLHRMAFDALASRVARAGEPFVGFFTPAELELQLRAIGYARVEDWDAARLNARYCAGRSDGFKVSGALGRMMFAGA